MDTLLSSVLSALHLSRIQDAQCISHSVELDGSAKFDTSVS